jgi:hypothetical protein
MPVRQPSAAPGASAASVARWLRAAAAVVVAVAALALVAVAARSGRTETLTPSTTRPAATPGGLRTAAPRSVAPPVEPPEPTSWSLPPGVYLLLVVLTAVGLLAVGIRLARGARRRPGWWQRLRGLDPPPDPRARPLDRASATAEALTGAIDTGLRRMAEGPPRDAVIACWVLLERAAAEAGVARRPAETAAELTERVLRQHRVSAGALRSLADLYREARFSTHPLGEAARAAASAALAQVRAELAQPGAAQVAETGPEAG